MVDRRTNKSPQLRSVVFVDASAFVALAREDDTNHAQALALLDALAKLPVSLTTSNYVFAESVTVISQRIDHAAALAFIERMKSPRSPFSITWFPQDLEGAALELFAQQTSKNVSFVDCTTMALVEHASIDYIFSFDKIFQQRGYHVVEELVERTSA